MELSYIIKKIEAGDPPEEIVLDGHDRDMLKAAHTTRLKIVEWYRKRLNHPVPQLGNYIEGPNARPWVRGDLLAAEMVRNGKDVPESGPERENVILRYLLNMSERSTWGSTPEYFAAACMTGKKIHVRQMNEKGELFIINSVNGSSIPPPVIIGNQVEPPKLLPPQQPPKLPPPLQNETEFSPEVVSTAIVLSPELCDSSFHDSSSAACSLSSASSQVKLFSTKALNDSEMDAELYGETDAMGGETECEESDDSKSEVGDYGSDNDSDDGEECKESDDDDGSYNLFFSNNHYQALVTHSQYLRLVAQYGIDAFRNFRGI